MTRGLDSTDLDGLLERHHGMAFGWALACCGWDRAEADEVLQATYLKVLDGRARFDGQASFKTWLYAVIRRTAQERRRQARWRSLALTRWLGDAAEPLAPSPAAQHEGSALSSGLRRALAELPERQRQVLHLVFYSDLSIAEAAAVLGMPLGTARTHYERGKQALRARVAGEDWS